MIPLQALNVKPSEKCTVKLPHGEGVLGCLRQLCFNGSCVSVSDRRTTISGHTLKETHFLCRPVVRIRAVTAAVSGARYGTAWNTAVKPRVTAYKDAA